MQPLTAGAVKGMAAASEQAAAAPKNHRRAEASPCGGFVLSVQFFSWRPSWFAPVAARPLTMPTATAVRPSAAG